MHTPRLDVHSNNTLCSGLDLSSLLLVVLGESLLANTNSLGIFLLVVTAEQINLIVVFLGRLLGRLASGLRAICGVGLGLARELRVFLLKGLDMSSPPSGIGVLGSVGGGLESLEDGYICLGRGMTAQMDIRTSFTKIVLRLWWQCSPINIASGLDPAVKRGNATVGGEIETHFCQSEGGMCRTELVKKFFLISWW
jgi:hypothetical protein